MNEQSEAKKLIAAVRAREIGGGEFLLRMYALNPERALNAFTRVVGVTKCQQKLEKMGL